MSNIYVSENVAKHFIQGVTDHAMEGQLLDIEGEKEFVVTYRHEGNLIQNTLVFPVSGSIEISVDSLRKKYPNIYKTLTKNNDIGDADNVLLYETDFTKHRELVISKNANNENLAKYIDFNDNRIPSYANSEFEPVEDNSLDNLKESANSDLEYKRVNGVVRNSLTFNYGEEEAQRMLENYGELWFAENGQFAGAREWNQLGEEKGWDFMKRYTEDAKRFAPTKV
ncbi:MAG: hypothetical protein ABIF08_02445 [Nanoarchaeota archaeon]